MDSLRTHQARVDIENRIFELEVMHHYEPGDRAIEDELEELYDKIEEEFMMR